MIKSVTLSVMSLCVCVLLVGIVFAESVPAKPAEAEVQLVTTMPIILPAPAWSPEKTAQNFLRHDEVCFYVGGFQRQRVAKNATREESAEFEMNKDMSKITYLVINGVVIVNRGETPLAEFPWDNADSATNVFVWLYGLTVNYDIALEGTSFVSIVKPGDPFSVILQPYMVKHFVPFNLNEKGNPDFLVLTTADGSTYSYDENLKGFTLWVNPSFVVSYTIFDTSTQPPTVFGRGDIDFSQPDPVDSGKGSALSVGYQNNVEPIPFRDGYNYFYRNYQGLPTWDSQGEQAAIFWYDTKDLELNIWVSGLEGQIVVKKYVEYGEMPTIAKAEGTEQIQLNLLAGQGKVIIIFTGQPQYDNSTFSVQFSRSYYGKG